MGRSNSLSCPAVSVPVNGALFFNKRQTVIVGIAMFLTAGQLALLIFSEMFVSYFSYRQQVGMQRLSRLYITSGVDIFPTICFSYTAAEGGPCTSPLSTPYSL